MSLHIRSRSASGCEGTKYGRPSLCLLRFATVIIGLAYLHLLLAVADDSASVSSLVSALLLAPSCGYPFGPRALCTAEHVCTCTDGKELLAEPGTYLLSGESSDTFSTATTLPCPAGSFCLGSRTPAQACLIGQVCPPMSRRPDPCPEYHLCLLPSLSKAVPCQAGRYCSPSFQLPTNAAQLTYGQLWALASKPCPFGYYCAASAEAKKCSDSQLCAIGSSVPATCPDGRLCDAEHLPTTAATLSATELVKQAPLCPGGFYCNYPQSSTSSRATVQLAKSSSGSSGSSAPRVRTGPMNPCPAGWVCPEGSSTPSAPAPGTAAPREHMAQAEVCEAGTFDERRTSEGALVAGSTQCSGRCSGASWRWRSGQTSCVATGGAIALYVICGLLGVALFVAAGYLLLHLSKKRAAIAAQARAQKATAIFAADTAMSIACLNRMSQLRCEVAQRLTREVMSTVLNGSLLQLSGVCQRLHAAGQLNRVIADFTHLLQRAYSSALMALEQQQQLPQSLSFGSSRVLSLLATHPQYFRIADLLVYCRATLSTAAAEDFQQFAMHASGGGPVEVATSTAAPMLAGSQKDASVSMPPTHTQPQHSVVGPTYANYSSSTMGVLAATSGAVPSVACVADVVACSQRECETFVSAWLSHVQRGLGATWLQLQQPLDLARMQQLAPDEYTRTMHNENVEQMPQSQHAMYAQIPYAAAPTSSDSARGPPPGLANGGHSTAAPQLAPIRSTPSSLAAAAGQDAKSHGSMAHVDDVQGAAAPSAHDGYVSLPESQV